MKLPAGLPDNVAFSTSNDDYLGVIKGTRTQTEIGPALVFLGHASRRHFSSTTANRALIESPEQPCEARDLLRPPERAFLSLTAKRLDLRNSNTI